MNLFGINCKSVHAVQMSSFGLLMFLERWLSCWLFSTGLKLKPLGYVSGYWATHKAGHGHTQTCHEKCYQLHSWPWFFCCFKNFSDCCLEGFFWIHNDVAFLNLSKSHLRYFSPHFFSLHELPIFINDNKIINILRWNSWNTTSESAGRLSNWTGSWCRSGTQTCEYGCSSQNLKLRPCHIDRTTATSIWEGQGLRFSHKDRTFEDNNFFIMWLFALVLQAHNRPVGITGE